MRTITTRKEHICTECGHPIAAGTRAATWREVAVYDDDFDYSRLPVIVTFTHYYHPKCIYKSARHAERFARFKERCNHPEPFQETEYDYSLPGSINGDRCGLCHTLH